MLDNRRLGKQRVETLQVTQTLLGHRLVSKHVAGTRVTRTGKTVEVHEDLPPEAWFLEPITTRAWSNHSVTRMWRGYEQALWRYQNAVCSEWLARGFRDTCLEKTEYVLGQAPRTHVLEFDDPFWLGREDVHSSHRQTLLFKDPAHYTQFHWTEEPRYEYVWPVP